MNIRGGELHLRFFAVFKLLLAKLLFVLLLFLLVVKLTVNRIIVVGFPIFTKYLLIPLFQLPMSSDLVVRFVDVGHNIVIFLVVGNQLLLAILRDSKVSILKVKLGKFLVVDDVVSVSDRP